MGSCCIRNPLNFCGGIRVVEGRCAACARKVAGVSVELHNLHLLLRERWPVPVSVPRCTLWSTVRRSRAARAPEPLYASLPQSTLLATGAITDK
jgi:hypothetical protein